MEIIPQETIEQRIFLIRGHKVMIDRDLAELYGVETKYLNRQVRRNVKRFPEEFMFRLNTKEKSELVTICHRFQTMKHSAALPYAFSEHGVAMLSSVLNTERAIKISIIIVKTFIKLREIITTHRELALKLEALERKYSNHDVKIQAIFRTIKELLKPPKAKERRVIGF